MLVRPRAVTAGVLVAALVAALVAGCATGTPADEWAGRVCAALAPWRVAIEDLATSAPERMSAADTAEEAQARLLELLTEGESATETARAAVAAAGTPDADGGPEVAARFTAALAGMRDAYARAATQLRALPTQPAETFYDGVVPVMTRLTEEYRRSGVDTTTLDSPELREAFDRVDQCR
jgi:hypothetical protein